MTSTKRKQNHRTRGQSGVTCRYHGHSGCKICAQLPKGRP